MNRRCRLALALLVSFAPTVMAQTWQRPIPDQGCPEEEHETQTGIGKDPNFKRPIAVDSQLAKLTLGRGAARTYNTTIGACPLGVCPLLIIEVIPPSGKNACVARVQNFGLLRVPDNQKSLIIKWSIDATGTCSTKGKCSFDGADGIHIISNGSGQWSTSAYTATTFDMLDRNQPQFRNALLQYEPHVFWRDAQGKAQSCCPKDPRIIND